MLVCIESLINHWHFRFIPCRWVTGVKAIVKGLDPIERSLLILLRSLWRNSALNYSEAFCRQIISEVSIWSTKSRTNELSYLCSRSSMGMSNNLLNIAIDYFSRLATCEGGILGHCDFSLISLTVIRLQSTTYECRCRKHELGLTCPTSDRCTEWQRECRQIIVPPPTAP